MWTVLSGDEAARQGGNWNIGLYDTKELALEMAENRLKEGKVVYAIKDPAGNVAMTEQEVRARFPLAGKINEEALERAERNLPRNWRD
jgi:hypothetical protein